jgi:hypothetical protein
MTTFSNIATLWHGRVRGAQQSHFQSAVACERKHLWLGLPTVLLSTVVGSSVFATLDKAATDREKLIVGSLSVCAAALAAIQTFLRYTERAERHRAAGAKFGALKKELEVALQYPPNGGDAEETYLRDFKAQWDHIVDSSPTAQESFFQKYKHSHASAPLEQLANGAAKPENHVQTGSGTATLTVPAPESDAASTG